MGHVVGNDDTATLLHTQSAPEFDIIRMTNADPRFYHLVGPFLARRAIAKELGGPLWDEDAMRWFIAVGRDQRVYGFGVLREVARVIWFDNTYVLPEWRGRGVYRALLSARLAVCPPGSVVRAVATSKSIAALQRRGFTVRRQRGQWSELELLMEPKAEHEKEVATV
jgi:GNAT superfamily N-acetyltransferase